jgi:hypothetical protein
VAGKESIPMDQVLKSKNSETSISQATEVIEALATRTYKLNIAILFSNSLNSKSLASFDEPDS